MLVFDKGTFVERYRFSSVLDLSSFGEYVYLVLYSLSKLRSYFNRRAF